MLSWLARGTEEGESSEEDEDEAGKESKADKTVGGRIKAPKEERTLKKLADPRLPTQKEVEEHNRTHLPYRNWCPHCARALGHDLDHARSPWKRRGACRSSLSTIVSRATSWAAS